MTALEYGPKKVIKRIRLFSLIVLILFANYSMARSSLEVSEEFNIVSVNGQSHKNDLFSGNRIVNLIPGLNKIALEYEAVFEVDNDDFDIVKSSPFVISFYAPTNRRFKLKHIKQANTKAARKFAINPLVSIKSDGQLVRSNLIILASNSDNYINQQTNINSKQTPITITSSPATAKTHKRNLSLTPSADDMLKYWWDIASKEQREAFLKSIELNK